MEILIFGASDEPERIETDVLTFGALDELERIEMDVLTCDLRRLG